MSGVPKLVLIGDTQVTLYENMVRMRGFAEQIGDLIDQGELDESSRPRIGLEAVAAGVNFHLASSDLLFASRPALAAALGKGVDMTSLAAQCLKRASGCGGGIGGIHAFAAPEHGLLGVTTDSAAPLLNAVGAAAAHLRDEESSDPDAAERLPLTLGFFGADGLLDGAFYEAIRCAGEWELPTIFVGHIDAARGLATKRWATFAKTEGLAAVQADGRSMSDVYAASHEAVRRAREDEGPSLLMFDVAIGQSGDELPAEDDPLEVMWRQLIENHDVTPDEIDEIHQRCGAELTEAINVALDAPQVNWRVARQLMMSRETPAFASDHQEAATAQEKQDAPK